MGSVGEILLAFLAVRTFAAALLINMMISRNQMNMEGQRDLPTEFLDPFIPFLSKLSILSDHFFDTPPPKADSALACGDTRLPIENEQDSFAWCNINNSGVIQAWAAQWKK